MKHLCCIVFLFLSLTGHAQIKKGQTVWTAQINSQFSQYKSGAIKNPITNLGLTGDVSFFIRDGLALGVAATGSWNHTKNTVDQSEGFNVENTTGSGSVTPFVRKYWQLKPVFIYAGAGVDLSFSKLKSIQQVSYQIYQDDLNRNFGVGAQAQLGVIFPVTRHLGLEFAAQSALFPVSFNSIRLGLVIASGTNEKTFTDTNSPLHQGRWILSGSFSSKLSKGYTTNSDGFFKYRDPSTTFEIAPGFFVRDRLMMGLGIFAGFRNGVLNDPGKVGYTGVGDKKPFLIGLRPFIKKYFSQTRLTPYLEGFASYDRIMAGGPATNSYNAGGNFGLAYVFGKNWLIEGRLLVLSGGYSEIGTAVGDGASIIGGNRFILNFDAGLKPNFTVSYIF